jgi:hypothetical protein
MAVERYPDFLAGQKSTADLLTSSQPMLVYKTADTARTSTTSSADPHLTLSVEANAVYTVHGLLIFNGSDEATDMNVDWNAPSGSTGIWAGLGQPTGATTTDGDVRTVGSGITSARSYGVDNGGASNPLTIIVNTLLVTSSTAGTYELVWGCVNSSGTVTLMANSFLEVQRYV